MTTLRVNVQEGIEGVMYVQEQRKVFILSPIRLSNICFSFGYHVRGSRCFPS